MTESQPPSPTTAEGDPTWLNPATIKGAILIALGLLFLLFPNASTPVLRYGIGTALAFFGASDLWSFNGDLPSIQELEASLSESIGRDVTVEVDYFETVRITFSKDQGLSTSDPGNTP